MLKRMVFVFFGAVMSTLTAAAESTRKPPPAIVLAEVFRQSIDPALYLASEKYDGVRAIWNGHELRFRSGNHVNAPEWFTARLPSTPLDGELWMGRGKFNELAGTVRRSEPIDSEWRQVRYMIFEIPDAPGSFSERAARIEELVNEAKLPWLVAVKQFKVADIDALYDHFKRLTGEGAEGIMLHLANAPYVTGRSDVLLKLKPLQDAEATVIGYVAGKGRYTGKTGALIVTTKSGKTFRVGSGLTEEVRAHPPAIGSVITFRYQELSPAGIPRFPRYWRLREEF
ncbi:MAG: DNA ligase [Rhodocyclaceae bacterium]|nr:DNA ligase [Rhodocyclaceae bacterium]MBP7081197.1 DNA ligase [Rhodocyclaceae bacterium]